MLQLSLYVAWVRGCCCLYEAVLGEVSRDPAHGLGDVALVRLDVDLGALRGLVGGGDTGEV